VEVYLFRKKMDCRVKRALRRSEFIIGPAKGWTRWRAMPGNDPQPDQSDREQL
jgi:hypothetical protein